MNLGEINEEVLSAFNEIQKYSSELDSDSLESVLEVMAIQLSGGEMFPEDCDKDSTEFKDLIPQILFLLEESSKKSQKPEKVKSEKPNKNSEKKSEKPKPEKPKPEKVKREVKVKEPKKVIDDELGSIEKVKMTGYANKGKIYGRREKYDSFEYNGEVFKVGEKVLVDTNEHGRVEAMISYIAVTGYDVSNNPILMVRVIEFEKDGILTPFRGKRRVNSVFKLKS